ncbi:interleukin-27 subunit beta-like [Heptranchias perlo]|uniref:interleukin-27 subunit beta-like n=1 Tax=Heptranchias perlo TaxID=212740 RepID=UPI00355A132D
MYEKLTVILGAAMVLLNTSGTTVGQSVMGGVVVQYGQIGRNITLSCNNTGNRVAEWRLNDLKIIEARGMELTRTNLTLFNANPSKEGEYSCHDQESGNAYNRVSLMLGYPPGKPQVTCWSVRYPLNVACSWKLENKTYLPTEVNVTYRYGMGDVKICSTGWTMEGSCIIEYVNLFSEIPYTVKVMATNPLGFRSTFKQFIVEKIIKPDPPTDVRLSPISNQPKKLLLQWKPPVTWPDSDLFLLKYTIKYWRAGSNRPRMIEVSDQTSYTLSGLRSRALYFVEVAAKDFIDNGESSDWSPAVSARLWSN